MKFFLMLLLISTVIVPDAKKGSREPVAILFEQCSDINSQNYKSRSYIKLAEYLQSLGETKAITIITEHAKMQKYEDQIIILTKMLFKSRKNMRLRRPMIGGAGFLGRTDYQDWPNEPIEIVDNVPFLITQGYMLGGHPEASLSYLKYCQENGYWVTKKYSSKTDKELTKALNSLLNSPKWRTKLSTYEQEFLKKQI